MKYVYSITDMCCCQLAAAVAHLLPVLNSSCLCFVAPKQGPDSGPKNGATILKLVAQLPNLTPILDHGICVLPSAKSALSCDRLHLSFMFSCAWCQDAGFPVYRYDFLCVYIYIFTCIIYLFIFESHQSIGSLDYRFLPPFSAILFGHPMALRDLPVAGRLHLHRCSADLHSLLHNVHSANEVETMSGQGDQILT